MASSIAEITMPRSIDFSRATASAICSSSNRLALTAMAQSPLISIGPASARAHPGEAVLLGILRRRLLLGLGRSGIGTLTGVRRGRGLEPEVALQLPFGGLAATHRFGDQLV